MHHRHHKRDKKYQKDLSADGTFYLSAAHAHFLHNLEPSLIFVAFGDLFIINDHRRSHKEQCSQKDSNKQDTSIIHIISFILTLADTTDHDGILRKTITVAVIFQCLINSLAIPDLFLTAATDIYTKMNCEIFSRLVGIKSFVHLCPEPVNILKVRIRYNNCRHIGNQIGHRT